jgi:hypothetical protein
MVGEVYGGKQNPVGTINDYRGIMDVGVNRKEDGRWGKNLADVFMSPSQFNAWMTTDKHAYPQAMAAFAAALNPSRAAIRDPVLAQKVELAKQAAIDVGLKGTHRGITKGATYYDNPAVTALWGTDKTHRAMERDFGALDIGNHRFSGPEFDRNATFDPLTANGNIFGNIGMPMAADFRGAYPDQSMGSFYGSQPDWGLQDLQGAPPDWSAQDLGAFQGPVGAYSFGNEAPRSGMGLGVTGYGIGELGTANMPGMGQYDNLPGSFDFGQTVNGAFGTPPNTNDVFSGQPMGGPQSFSQNYGGLSPNAFQGGTFQPDVSATAFGANFPGFSGYGLAAPQQTAAVPKEMGDISEEEMAPSTQRGITGYNTTTTQVHNPAYDAWASSYGNKPNALQDAWLGAMQDKIGVQRGPFTTMPPNAVPNAVPKAPPAPPQTIAKTNRTPVYGQIPQSVRKSNIPQIAHPATTLGLGWGGDDGYGGFLSGNTAMAQVGNFGNYGLRGFDGTFGTGITSYGQPVAASPFGGFFSGIGGALGFGGGMVGGPNIGSGWGQSGDAGGLGGAGGFSGGDAGYGSDARSGRDGADQGNN